MKYGKYVAGVLLVAAIGTGGAVVASHHAPHKTTASVKVSHHHKAKHVDKKKASSSSSSSSSNSSIQSSSSVAASSQVTSDASSTAPTSQPVAQDNSQTDASSVPYDNGDPNIDIHAFINKYGTTPAGWLVQNKGMSVKDALAATPDTMETSGELQDEYMYDQGQDPVQAYQDAQNSGDVQENADEGTQPSDDNTGWSDATE